MPRFAIVNKETHGRYQWLPHDTCFFAKDDTIAPLVVNEFQRASQAAPIAFLQHKGTYTPIMLQGLENNTNLFVSERGKWRGSYMPACYRSHPFCALKNHNHQWQLAVISDSEFVLDSPKLAVESKPFFREGELAEETIQVLKFLKAVEENRELTVEFTDLLNAYALFKPWVPQVRLGDKNKAIEGLFCVDENVLRGLEGEQLLTLMQKNVLGLVYCHLSSLQNLSRLEMLCRFGQEEGSPDNTAGHSDNDIFVVQEEGGSVDFDWMG